MRTRLLAVLLSMPLAAAGATGAVLHVCQSMGGVARGDCDCERAMDHGGHGAHVHHAAHVSQSTHKLHAQPCCSVQASDASGYVATHEASSTEVDDATSVFAGLANATVPSSRFACDVDMLRERAPPTVHGPPLFIRNCSFLN